VTIGAATPASRLTQFMIAATDPAQPSGAISAGRLLLVT
jgi:hypothetical protein